MADTENPTGEPRNLMRKRAVYVTLLLGLSISTCLFSFNEGANRNPSPTRPQATSMAVISPSIGGDTENPVGRNSYTFANCNFR